MTTYSNDFKQSITAKMLVPNSTGVYELAKETGIPKGTLYTWRAKYGKAKPAAERNDTNALSSEDKFSVIIETETLNEVELSEYCRRKGLYPTQILEWKNACLQANAGSHNKADPGKLRVQSKQIKQLEAELRRKEKALAEAAVLLILQKKVQAIWEEPEDEKSNPRCVYK